MVNYHSAWLHFRPVWITGQPFVFAHSVTLNPNRQPAYIVERWLIRFQLSVFYLNILVRIIPLAKLPFLFDGFRWSIKTAEFICIFCFCISAAFAKSFKVVFCFYHVRRFSTLLPSRATVLVIHWFYLLVSYESIIP